MLAIMDIFPSDIGEEIQVLTVQGRHLRKPARVHRTILYGNHAYNLGRDAVFPHDMAVCIASGGWA